MNNELFEALSILEKEKNISKETLLEAIRQSLLQACKNHYNKNEPNNVVVNIDPETCEFEIYAEKTVVEKVEDELTEISLADARMKNPRYDLGDVVRVDIRSKEFGNVSRPRMPRMSFCRKSVRKSAESLYNQYYREEKDVVTGIVQRLRWRKNVSIKSGQGSCHAQ